MKRPDISELTLTEKISQLLMVSQFYSYTKIENGKEVLRDKNEIREFMSKYQYGSLWSTGQLYMSNVNMTEDGVRIDANVNKRMVEFISSNVRLPMLVGIDCESAGAGSVFGDCTKTCNALAIGAANDEQLTFELNAAVAREIRAAGANWRWTPVVDFPNRLNGVSFGRTFSDDIEKCVRLSIAAIKGTESEKVASTVKHFPGADPYGIHDSHIVSSQINTSLDEWREKQGRSFKGVIDAGVDTVMVGHTSFPAADDTMVNGHYLPATLSKKIIQGLLREELGFEGIVITDGIGMAGLLELFPYDEVLIQTINAGTDVILGVNPEDFELVHKAVLDGKIPMERINESAERVLKLKEKIGLFDEVQETIDLAVQTSITQEINNRIAEKSITLLKDKNNLIPLAKDKINNVIIVCSSHYSETVKELEVMKEEFEKRGANVKLVEDVPNKAYLSKIADENDLLVFAAYLGPHRPMGMPSLYDEKLKTYFTAFTIAKEKSIGVSLGYPYMHVDFMAGAETFFNIYNSSPESLRAFVKVLYGEIKAEGTSPVDIIPKLRYVYC